MLCRVFDEADRNRQFGFHGFACHLAPGYQSARGTVSDLASEHRLDPGVIGSRDLVPHLAMRVAKAAECAEVLRIRQLHRGTVENPCMGAIGARLAVSVPSKPIFLCVPSQNGLLFE